MLRFFREFRSRLRRSRFEQFLRPPEGQQNFECARNIAERHFARSVKPRAVPHTCFRDFEAQLPGASEHLRVDKEAVRLGQKATKSFLAKDLQSTVTIAHAGSEQGSCESVIAPRKEPPLPRILAVDSIADGNVLLV